MPIVAAVGTAGGGGNLPKGMAKELEEAMGDAIVLIGKQCEEIWAKPDMSVEQKNAEIAKLQDPKYQIAAKTAARKAVMQKFSDAQTKRIKEEEAAREAEAKAAAEKAAAEKPA